MLRWGIWKLWNVSYLYISRSYDLACLLPDQEKILKIGGTDLATLHHADSPCWNQLTKSAAFHSFFLHLFFCIQSPCLHQRPSRGICQYCISVIAVKPYTRILHWLPVACADKVLAPIYVTALQTPQTKVSSRCFRFIALAASQYKPFRLPLPDAW